MWLLKDLEDFLTQAFSGAAQRRAPLPEGPWRPLLEEIWKEDAFHGELVVEGKPLRVVALGEEVSLKFWGLYPPKGFPEGSERSWKRKPLLEAFLPVGHFSLQEFSHSAIETLLEGVRLWAQASGFRFPHPKAVLASLGEEPSEIWLSPSLRLLVLSAWRFQGRHQWELKITTVAFSPYGEVVASAEGALATTFMTALSLKSWIGQEPQPLPEEEIKRLLETLWSETRVAPDPQVAWGVLEGRVPPEVLGL